MSTRSPFTRIVAFAVAFMLVMSVAGVSVAGTEHNVTVSFISNEGTLSVEEQTLGVLAESNTIGTISIRLPLSDVGSGNCSRQISGWKYDGDTYYPGARVSVTVNRYNSRSDWEDISFTAVWSRTSEANIMTKAQSSAEAVKAGSFLTSGRVGTVTVPDAPSRKNYTFTGWTLSGATVYQENSNEFIGMTRQFSPSEVLILKVSGNSITFTANWIASEDSSTRTVSAECYVCILDSAPTNANPDSTTNYTVKVGTCEIRIPAGSGADGTDHSYREFDLQQNISCIVAGTTPNVSTGVVWYVAKYEGLDRDGCWHVDGYTIASSAQQYTVSFNEGEHGTIAAPDADHPVIDGSVTYEDLDAKSSMPLYPDGPIVTPDPGYEYTGWDTVITDKVSGDVTFTAQYEKITEARDYYAIDYVGFTPEDEAAADWPADVALSELKPTSLAQEPTKNGFAFSGWTPATVDWNSANVVSTVETDEYLDEENNTFYTRTLNVLTVTGGFTELEAERIDVYSVNYILDGEEYATSAAYVNKTADYEGFAAVAAAPSGLDAEKYFVGWYENADAEKTPITAITAGMFTETSHAVTSPAAPGAAEITTYYHSLTLAGEIKTRTAQRDEYVVNYTVQNPDTAVIAVGAFDAKSVTATSSVNAQALPAITVDAAHHEAYSISGWSVGGESVAPGAAFDWTGIEGVKNEVKEAGADGLTYLVTVTTYNLEATATITQKDRDAQFFYTLTYAISGTYTAPDGTALTTPSAPAGVSGGAQPSDLASAPALKGHSFNGWKQGSVSVDSVGDITWGEAVHTGEHYDRTNNIYVDEYLYTAALTGDYAAKAVSEAARYNVDYQNMGAVDGDEANRFPADVVNAVSAPSLAAAPSRAGYSFEGWYQGSGTTAVDAIDWSGIAPVVSYVYNADDTWTKVSTYNMLINGALVRCENTVVYEYTVKYAVDLNMDGVKEEVDMGALYTGTFNAMPSIVAGEPSGIPAAYQFKGWDKASPLTQADFGEGSSVTTPSTEVGVGDIVTTSYTLVIKGEIEKCPDVEVNKYSVKYKADLNLDGTAEEIGIDGFSGLFDKMPAAVAGEPSGIPAGYSFAGWDKTSALTYDDFTHGAPVRTPSTVPGIGDTLTVTHSITLNGTLEKLTATRSEYIVNYSVTNGFKDEVSVGGFDASAMKSASTELQAQALPKLTLKEGAKDAYSVKGWMQGSMTVAAGHGFDWSNVAGVTASSPVLEKVNGVDTFVTVTTYTIDASASVTKNARNELDLYTLTYSVNGTYTAPDGTALTTPAAPAGVNEGTKPAALAKAPALEGHSFAGWMQGENAIASVADITWGVRTKTDTRYDEATDTYTDVYLSTASLNGSYSKSMIKTVEYWNVDYVNTGDAADNNLFPADVANAATAPELAVTPSKPGASFNGWYQGTTETVSAIDWSTEPAVSYVLNADNTYTKVIAHSAIVTGAFDKCSDNEISKYVVKYFIDLDLDGTAEEVTMSGFSGTFDTMPTGVAGSPEGIPADHMFKGWDKASPLTQADFGEGTSVTTPSTEAGVGNTVTVTYTLNITGSILESFDVTFKVGEGGTFENGTDDVQYLDLAAGSAFPAVPAATSLENYKFVGWFVESGDQVAAFPMNMMRDYTFIAKFMPYSTSEKLHYTLSYSILPVTDSEGIDITPAAPADETGDMPIEAKAVPAEVKGFFFGGWSNAAYQENTALQTVENVGNDEIVHRYFFATAVGSYQENPPEPEPVSDKVYTLNYFGYEEGVSNWPYNTYRVTFFPVLTGLTPSCGDLVFTGWSPAVLDWSNPDVINEIPSIVVDENGNTTVHIQYEYVINVYGSFESENIPLAPPTGDGEVIGFAAVLIAAATGIFVNTFVRRKRGKDNAE